MRIIIVGVGKSGSILAKQLEKSNHDVIVVDKSKEIIEDITNNLSVNGVCGSGASSEILLAAGADTADILISMTPVDETNILVCSMAKKSGTKYVVASLDREELLRDSDFLKERFGIDYILTPDKIVSEKIAEQVYFNAANKVENLVDSKVLMTELMVQEDSILSDSSLNDIKKNLKVDFLVFAVNRNGKILVPTGEFVLKQDDIIGIVAEDSSMIKLITQMGFARKPVKQVILIGGGDIALNLAKLLHKNRISVKIIENNRMRCKELMNLLPGIDVVFGNGIDVQLLEDEKIRKTDACICLTDKDETNLLVSLIAWSNGVNNILTKINSDDYEKVLRQVTINVTISPDRIMASKLMEIIQSVQNKDKFAASTSKYFELGNGTVKISEFNIPKDFNKCGNKLMSGKMKLKKGMVILAIIRDSKMIIPKGDDVLEAGDKIITITEKDCIINSLLDIFVDNN